MSEYNAVLNRLKEKGIRLSYQRIQILKYLTENRTHPTVDAIYQNLVKAIPTLSKTTVYNTVDVFEKIGLVKELSGYCLESHYDIDTHPHGHFRCERCATLYDFELNIDSLNPAGLERFCIKDKDVFYKGICPKCMADNNEK